MQTTIFVKTRANHDKKSSKFIKKIAHVDDMMIHNLVKYLVQTRLRLWDIKITNFKPESCPDDLLEICYFYISQTKSSLNKIFYKVVYHHIIYMYDFFDKFRRLFCYDLHRFSRDCGLHRCFFEKPRRVRLFLALQQNFWVTGWRQSIISPASTRQEKKKGANFCTSSSLLHFNFAKAKFTASHDQRLRYCCQCTFYGNIE